MCRDGVRNTKAQLELNLARDTKDNEKGFYRHVSQERRKQAYTPQVNTTGKQVTTDKKAEGLNFSASVFMGNLSSHT